MKAHLAMCYMTFCCVQHLCYLLKARGYRMSTARIQRVLLWLHIRILYDTADQGRYGLPCEEDLSDAGTGVVPLSVYDYFWASIRVRGGQTDFWWSMKPTSWCK